MNWKSTWCLVGLALGLFALIWFYERHTQPSATTGQPPPRVLPISAAQVSVVQVRRTNQLVLRVERSNQVWNITAPIFYPAQTYAIQRLLQNLDELVGPPCLQANELAAQGRTLADYGLATPQAAVVLEGGGKRVELLFGTKTPVGDQVYVQVLAAPGIYLAPAEWLDRLPHIHHDWRDPSLVNLGDLALDRFEVRAAGRGFTVVLDRTNQMFRLTKPTQARADRAKVEALLRDIQTNRVAAFVTDDPGAELEPYGLAPPEAELVFGQGTNDVLVVQLGKSPTNAPGLVYARRLAQTNIVLVSRSLLEAIQTPYTALRDRRLLSFDPRAVDRLEVVADERFAVSRYTNGQWRVEPPVSRPADADLVRDCIHLLAGLEGDVEKDVVTDFASYGLDPPARQYLLWSAATNADGTVSNRLLARLDLSGRVGDRLFARGADAHSVFGIKPSQQELLPVAAWQLRDRRVWTFTTNQVQRLTIRHNGYTRELVRYGPAQWRLAPGSVGVINPLAVEEMAYRLSELRAVYWVEYGDRNRARYGFRDDGFRLTIELAGPDGPETRVLEFAPLAESQFPLALASWGNEAWIFRFPPDLFFPLLLHLGNPPKPRAAPGEG
jgi:hypothetical protein